MGLINETKYKTWSGKVKSSDLILKWYPYTFYISVIASIMLLLSDDVSKGLFLTSND